MEIFAQVDERRFPIIWKKRVTKVTKKETFFVETSEVEKLDEFALTNTEKRRYHVDKISSTIPDFRKEISKFLLFFSLKSNEFPERKSTGRRGECLEQVVGIFDGQAEYAGRLINYINERKDIGCFAVSFRKEEELLSFCERKKLVSLILGGKTKEEIELLKDKLPAGMKVWELSDELGDLEEGRLFRYQKVGNIIRLVMAEVQRGTAVQMSELFTVFSPESNRMAEEYALSLARKLAEQGRTLFLPWDAFLGYQRAEKEEAETPSISELLYFLRKDIQQAKKLFAGIRKKKGMEYFCGPDYSSDLWQYSPEEMQKLLLCCKEYGGYDHIVFLSGMFHEGILSVMHQSNRVYLVCSKSKEGNSRKNEFLRQMKYAGEQDVLLKLQEEEAVR